MDSDGRLRLDAHVHLIGIDRDRHNCYYAHPNGVVAFYVKRTVGARPGMTDAEIDDIYAEHLARLVREARCLDKAVIFGMDGAYDSEGLLDPRTEAVISNDWTMQVCERYPDEFVFGASIHPGKPDALDELEKCAANGAVCVKWVPNSMNIDPSDRRYVPFYERMRELGLVLTSHTGYEHSVYVFDQSLGDPERLRLPLECGLTVVAGHAGTSGFHHRVEYFPNLIRLVNQFDRLFADTSAVANIVRAPYRRRLIETPVVKDRLLQGTDYPVPPMPVLWPFSLGLVNAIRIQFMKNPFDRDYEGKIQAGFPLEHFYRGHDVFLSGAARL